VGRKKWFWINRWKRCWAHSNCLSLIFTGYGDLAPANDASRVFTIFFALYGINILGMFLGNIGEYVIEKQEESMQKRMKNSRLKVMEQFAEDDSALPPEERSYWKDLVGVCIKELPIFLVLIAIASPIVYIEGWDVVMG
jgi:hypothetical protein